MNKETPVQTSFVSQNTHKVLIGRIVFLFRKKKKKLLPRSSREAGLRTLQMLKKEEAVIIMNSQSSGACLSFFAEGEE